MHKENRLARLGVSKISFLYDIIVFLLGNFKAPKLSLQSNLP